MCVRFLTILVFLINAITLWFDSARTALHHIAYVAWNCTIILNFFRDFFPRLLHLIQLLFIKTKRTTKYMLVIAFIAFGGFKRSLFFR